ncbi:MAG: glycosyltransferase family 2 protein [Prevotella sp.]|jgi:GT2 family glycosyltransferase
MRILAIIVSFNFMPWIDRCLGSLRQSAMPIDVIVIDNASKDDTTTAIKEKYPEVKLVENKGNLGFGKANNIGMEYAVKAGYDAVLLLNQDAWIDTDTLTKLVNAGNSHPEYGILSPVHLTGSGKKIEFGFADYCGLSDLARLPSQEIVSVPFINAAIWYMPLKTLRNVGFFSPIFYHYGEDKDMVNRMKYHGYRIGYLPGAFGYHDREFRQETRKRFLHSEYVYHLTEYTNINYGFGKAFAMSVLAACKKMLSAVRDRKWNDAAAYVGLSIRLIFKTHRVVQTRNLSKHVDLKHYL